MMDRVSRWSNNHDGYEPLEALAARFDAWGNLTKMQEFDVTWRLLLSDYATLRRQMIFSYDALGRRGGEIEGPTVGTLYVDLAGNVLEERKGQEIIQYVWSPATGEIILRDRDHIPNQGYPTTPPGIDERLYALYDGQGNITAITSNTGQVVERYFYSPEGMLLITDADGVTRTGSSYGWRYLFRGGRWDGRDIYSIGGQEWDYLSGGALEHDPLAYWGEHLTITPPSMSFYDRAVVTTVPILIGVTVGIATGGLGFAASGFFGGLAGGFAGGYTSRYAAGGSVGQSAASGAIGGAIGGIAGFAGGAVMGRLATGAYMGGASASRAGSFAVQLGREMASGGIEGGASGLAEGAVSGYRTGGWGGALVGAGQGGLYGTGIGALTAGAFHSAGAAVPYVLRAGMSFGNALGETADALGSCGLMMRMAGDGAGWRKATAKSTGLGRFPHWNVGDSITKITPEGSYPDWATIRSRYWQNRAAADGRSYGAANRAIMERGYAPKARVLVRDRATGQYKELLVEKELHHARGNRGTPGYDEPVDLREVWPWQHERLSPPGRNLDYDFVGFISERR